MLGTQILNGEILSDPRRPQLTSIPQQILPQHTAVLLIGPDVPIEASVAPNGLEAIMIVGALESEVLARANILEVPEAALLRGLPLKTDRLC